LPLLAASIAITNRLISFCYYGLLVTRSTKALMDLFIGAPNNYAITFAAVSALSA
jgi:hypothetical protein